MNKSNNDALINALRSEIKFLRNEMSSKDTIIKLLINDLENVTKDNISDNIVKEKTNNNTYNNKNNLVKKYNPVNKERLYYVKNDLLNTIDNNTNLNDASDFESIMPRKSKKKDPSSP